MPLGASPYCPIVGNIQYPVGQYADMDNREMFLGLLVALLTVISFLIVAPILQYILGAALLAFILYPVHVRLVDDVPHIGPRVSAGLLTGTSIVVAVVPLIVLTLILFDTAITFLEDFTQEDFINAVASIRELVVSILGIDPTVLETMEERVIEEATEAVAGIVDRLLNEIVSLLNFTFRTSLGLLLLIFLLYYFLVDGKTFVGWVQATAPIDYEVSEELLDEVSTVSWAVIGSHLLVAVVEGILGGIGLWLVGFPNAAFWAVVMIVASVLPVVGVWLIWAPVVLYLFVTGDMTGGIVLLVYGLAVLSVVDNYLRAIFVDHGSGLHPAVVLIGVLGGIYLLGVLGLFLGPVLLAVLKASIIVFVRSQDGDLPTSLP